MRRTGTVQGRALQETGRSLALPERVGSQWYVCERSGAAEWRNLDWCSCYVNQDCGRAGWEAGAPHGGS